MPGSINPPRLVSHKKFGYGLAVEDTGETYRVIWDGHTTKKRRRDWSHVNYDKVAFVKSRSTPMRSFL
jgi:hypothetical protein